MGDVLSKSCEIYEANGAEEVSQLMGDSLSPFAFQSAVTP
jgi:hypothetical protein